MVSSVGVSKFGKTTLINPGTKMNGEYYQNGLLELIPPKMRILEGGGHFIFKQDGARANTAKDAVAYLKDNVPEFIIEPENRPQNSPDLNPVDYSIWKCINIKGLGMLNT